MFGYLRKKIKDWERRATSRYSHDISNPEERAKSQHYVDWLDHGILRRRWHNFAEVGPGFYRSNHPDDERFSDYAERGIVTVINLRGAPERAFYNFEAESCERLGLTLITLSMSARLAPKRETLLELLRVLETAQKPALVHCKSGADRTGLVSAIYRIHCLGQSIAQARVELSPRYLHFRMSKTGILDYILDLFEAAHKRIGISLEAWIAQDYDAEKVQADFEAMNWLGRLGYRR